jgi:hypothetical protein
MMQVLKAQSADCLAKMQLLNNYIQGAVTVEKPSMTKPHVSGEGATVPLAKIRELIAKLTNEYSWSEPHQQDVLKGLAQFFLEIFRSHF